MSVETQIAIKENPSAGSLGLEKEGRSKFPGCYDTYYPKKGRDGRWLTGIDEDAVSVNSITDSDKRIAEKERIKKERESLEALTGHDLSGRSSFWESYRVKMNTAKPLDLTNPLDKIAYNMLIASDFVAPSLQAAKSSHRKCAYFVSRKYEEVSDKVAKAELELDAKVKFKDLLQDPIKLVMVGKYLNLPVTDQTPTKNVFDAFSTFFEKNEELDSYKKFLYTVSKPVEELQIKLVIDDALKLKVIRFKDGLYQRGIITLGKQIKDVIEFLNTPENSGELASIIEEVDMKRKYG